MKRILAKIADYIRECDKVLMLLCIFSSSFSCVAVLSATYGTTNSLRQFFTQAVAMLLGIVAVIIISHFDYHSFIKIWPLVILGGIIPVALTFFIGYAPGSTDDKAWLSFPGGLSFQPSELLKIAFAITFGLHVQKIGDNISQFRHVLLLCLHGAIPVLLIHFQGDDGTALVFAIMFVIMMFIAGIKMRYFAIAGAGAAIATPIVFFAVMNNDQRERILALFNTNPSEEDLLGILWQQSRGKTALANGGLFGTGLFNGPFVQGNKIPEGHNDFIFTGIGEELGFLGCLAVIILISAICLRVLKIGRQCNDKLGLTICAGIFAMLLSQLLINVGMCLSLLPVIGVTLPFFSAGGTSLLCLYIGIGVVMSVYMHLRNESRLRDEF